ncbi:MAG: energy transducer TonB [Bacteroidales bacterium]|nr:energy transducer TonB [Bacteroidales bacterium]
MVLFLEKNLKYPEELRLKSKEGVVMFHFIVRKDGKIDNIEYQKSDEPLFNQEASRVFSLIKYMKPAREHGRIIDKECTLPINFRLTNW